MEHEVLCDNDWLSLMIMKDESQGVSGYVYSHEKFCNGTKVALLPYRQVEGTIEYLIRDEVTPCWGMNHQKSSTTGSVEDGHTPTEMAAIELHEEAGYEVPAESLRPLGTCRGTKHTDNIYHLYTTDLSGVERGEASGDGSTLEQNASCRWTQDLTEITFASDPLLAMLYMRLDHYLRHQNG